MKVIDIISEPFIVNDDTFVMMVLVEPKTGDITRFGGRWYEDRILKCVNMRVVSYEKDELINELRVRCINEKKILEESKGNNN